MSTGESFRSLWTKFPWTLGSVQEHQLRRAQEYVWYHEADILNVSTIDWKASSWTRSALSHDQVDESRSTRLLRFRFMRWENMQDHSEANERWNAQLEEFQPGSARNASSNGLCLTLSLLGIKELVQLGDHRHCTPAWWCSRTDASGARLRKRRCRSSLSSPDIGKILLSIHGLAENFDTVRLLATWSQWTHDCVSMLLFGHPLLSNGLVAIELRRVSCLLSKSLVQRLEELS